MRSLNLNFLTQAARETLVRFPLPMLAAVFVTICLIFTVESGHDDETYARLALLGGLGFVACLLLDLFIEHTRTRVFLRLIYSAALILAVVAYSAFAMPAQIDNALPPFWYSHFILLFCLHLGIALVPLQASRDKCILWRFNLQLFLRFFFSSVNAALLYAGVGLALYSIDKLFGLNFDDEIYLQLWFICAYCAHPLLFLSGIPQRGELSDATVYPKALRFSLRFIALPLTALYLVILYTYVGKMAILWDWPDGWVAMPIFILAVISLLTHVLSVPLSKEEPWARFFHQWLFRLLLPLSIILFLALQVRLAEYGMTINRHLGLTLAVWLFGISAAYLLRPRLHVGWMPASLLLISLFAIYGGPAGAFDWSQRAQTDRVRQIAKEIGAWDDNGLSPTDGTADSDTVANFRSCLKYVFENFGPNALEAELAGFQQANPNTVLASRRAYNATNLVLTYLNLDSSTNQTVNYHYHGALPTFAHPWVLRDNHYSRNNQRIFKSPHGKISLKMDGPGNKLNISLDEAALAAIDTSDWGGQMIATVDQHGNKQPEPLVWHFEENHWRFSVVAINAQVKRKESKIDHLQYSLFYTPAVSVDTPEQK